MAGSIGGVGSTQIAKLGVSTPMERMVDSSRRLNEQTLQISQQNQQRINDALSTMINTQVQIQEQKVRVGQVLMNSGSIGSIINTTA